MIHIVKVFSLVNEAEVEMFFWKPLAFLCNPTDVDNLISDSFAFSGFKLLHMKVLDSHTVEA